jgi:UDP-3-O-[3-hydroxymyristoyl] glucosamine N-acyltransferase
MRVSEIAAFLGVEYAGNGDVEIVRAAPLDSAGPDEIAFVGNAKANRAAAASQAGCLIAAGDFPADGSRCVIHAADPRAAFARVIEVLHPNTHLPSGIHPTAVIDSTAQLADGVAVGPYCTIGANVRIGPGSVLHSHVAIYHDVTIGARAILHSGAVIGADGFGFAMVDGRYEKFPQVGRIEIGDDFEAGANSTIDRAALGATRIGNGVKLDNLVHIGHNVTIGDHVVIAAQTGVSGGAVIGDYAIVAGQVGIADKVRIEPHAILGAKCGVPSSKVIRSGQTVWGIPARPIKDYLEQLAHLAHLGELRREVADLKRRLAEAKL